MDELTTTKPYLIRAIYDWCIDNGLTPHLLVVASSQTRVPVAYVKDGEIVLNLSYSATKDLHMDNQAITFAARFAGVSQNIYVPISAVRGIFSRENGQGMFFEVDIEKDTAKQERNDLAPNPSAGDKTAEPDKKRPNLTIVK